MGNYLWSSGWIYYSSWPEMFDCYEYHKLSTREIRQLTGGDEIIPENWRFHPYLGLLPECFVDKSLVRKLFPEAKDLQTALVKDYELQFQVANRLGEIVRFNKMEIETIVRQTLQKRFNGASPRDLSDENKGKLAIILNREFGLSSLQIAKAIYIKEKTLRQLLGAKELR